MTTPQTILLTTDDVIDALGGNEAVAKIVGTTPNAVRNWRGRLRGKFPTDTYEAFRLSLKREGLKAPLALWGMKEPVRRRASPSQQNTEAA